MMSNNITWMSEDGVWVYDGSRFWKIGETPVEIVVNEELFSLEACTGVGGSLVWMGDL